eukprot:2939488-Ditylum_brightwellii.AAC.1
MVDYAIKHKGNCYEMYDLIKGYIYKLRNVIWLKWMYYPKLVLVDEDDNILPVPDDQDPDMAIQTMTARGINKGSAA